MRRLLAVGVKESWVGEWQLTQGNEEAVLAAPIGEGEVVWLEVEAADGTNRHKLRLSAIPTSIFLDKSSRYRVVKDCGGAAEPLATTVEVILSNGETSTRSRDA
jgi:hypothetical protein